jgi:hypothetical protein
MMTDGPKHHNWLSYPYVFVWILPIACLPDTLFSVECQGRAFRVPIFIRSGASASALPSTAHHFFELLGILIA